MTLAHPTRQPRQVPAPSRVNLHPRGETAMRIGYSEENSQMSRSEAQRRYQNLINYRVRPMLMDRSKTETDRILIIKRICREANNIRAEALAPAGPGTRQELVE